MRQLLYRTYQAVQPQGQVLIRSPSDFKFTEPCFISELQLGQAGGLKTEKKNMAKKKMASFFLMFQRLQKQSVFCSHLVRHWDRWESQSTKSRLGEKTSSCEAVITSAVSPIKANAVRCKVRPTVSLAVRGWWIRKMLFLIRLGILLNVLIRDDKSWRGKCHWKWATTSTLRRFFQCKTKRPTWRKHWYVLFFYCGRSSARYNVCYSMLFVISVNGCQWHVTQVFNTPESWVSLHPSPDLLNYLRKICHSPTSSPARDQTLTLNVRS